MEQRVEKVVSGWGSRTIIRQSRDTVTDWTMASMHLNMVIFPVRYSWGKKILQACNESPRSHILSSSFCPRLHNYADLWLSYSTQRRSVLNGYMEFLLAD